MNFREEKIEIGSNEYTYLHRWVIKNKGKASACSFNQEHQSKKFEWANTRKEYEWDLDSFISLCPSCHRKMDMTDAMRERCRQRQLGVVSWKKAVCKYEKDNKLLRCYPSIKDAAEDSGIIRTSIVNNLKGRAKTAGGFHWKYKMNGGDSN